jgi:hypothetical protein
MSELKRNIDFTRRRPVEPLPDTKGSGSWIAPEQQAGSGLHAAFPPDGSDPYNCVGDRFQRARDSNRR